MLAVDLHDIFVLQFILLVYVSVSTELKNPYLLINWPSKNSSFMQWTTWYSYSIEVHCYGNSIEVYHYSYITVVHQYSYSTDVRHYSNSIEVHLYSYTPVVCFYSYRIEVRPYSYSIEVYRTTVKCLVNESFFWLLNPLVCEATTNKKLLTRTQTLLVLPPS